MSLSINPSEIQIRVQRQFGDESGVQVTPDDILRWIDDAVREASIQNPKMVTDTLYFDSVAGSNSYEIIASGVGQAPSAIRMIYFLDSSNSYRKLNYLSIQEMDSYLNGWENSAQQQGEPEVYTYELTPTNTAGYRIRVFPTPQVSLASAFKVNMSKIPTLFTTGVGAPTVVNIPYYYFTYLVEYCLMKAYELDEDWEAADRKAQYIQSTLNLLANHEVMGADFYPSIMTLPEDM
jgi:Family of unknown function (DUF6682)